MMMVSFVSAIQCEGGFTCLDQDSPIANVKVGLETFKVELISASDNSATIKVNGLAEEVNEGSVKIFDDISVYMKSADENNLQLSATLLLVSNDDVILTVDNPTKTVTIGGKSYSVELISTSDTATTIKVNGEAKEISESQTKEVNGVNVYVKSADEDNLRLLAVLELKEVVSCEQDHTCLDSDNPSKTVRVGGKDYLIELVSASDTSATIKVNGVAKEISEGSTKEVGGINVYMKSADENNLILIVVLKLSVIVVEGCEEGYTCLDSDNPTKTVTIGGKSYSVELISTSDTATTIKVNGEAKEISESQTKEVNGVNVYVKSADESSLLLKAVIKLFESDEILLTSDSPIANVKVGLETFKVELISASDNSATIKVNGLAEEVNSGSSKEIGKIEVYLREVYETDLFLTTKIKVTEIQVINVNCTDSDGKDYYVRGKLCFAGLCKEDVCKDNKILMEYFCEDGEKFEEYVCPNGCSEGVCNKIIPEEEPVEVPENVQEEDKKLACQGCLQDEKCYPFGYRKEGRYCSDSNEFLDQQEEKTSCENNFQCDSNLCINNECVSGNLWAKFIRWLSKLFG